MRKMADVKRIWKQGLALGISLLVCACTVNKNDSDDGGGSDPPGYDFTEVEPNDAFDEAQFLTVLPEWSQKTLGADWWVLPEKDFFWFFLDPLPGISQLNFNLMINCSPTIHPGCVLFQTVYDSLGNITDYQVIGVYQGFEGNLMALDITLPFDPFYNNDLILMVKTQGTGSDTDYTLDFWND
jgi:hypothetical protein